MLIENGFEVPASIEDAWTYLLDVERVAPCAPGAELTEVVDETTWKGRMTMKLGPVSLSFAGTVAIRERDDADHRVVLFAKGQETKGKGAASATVTSWLEAIPEGTSVRMRADISLTGTVAQLSRGLLPDVSARLTQQFATCLRESMQAGGAAAAGSSGTGGATSTGRQGATSTGPEGATSTGPEGVPGRGTATSSNPQGTASTEHERASPAGATDAASASVAPRRPAARRQEIGGIRLGLWALWRALLRQLEAVLGELERVLQRRT